MEWLEQGFLGKSFWHLVNSLLINCLTLFFSFPFFLFFCQENIATELLFICYMQKGLKQKNKDWTGVEVRPISKLMKCEQMSQAYSLETEPEDQQSNINQFKKNFNFMR